MINMELEIMQAPTQLRQHGQVTPQMWLVVSISLLMQIVFMILTHLAKGLIAVLIQVPTQFSTTLRSGLSGTDNRHQIKATQARTFITRVRGRHQEGSVQAMLVQDGWQPYMVVDSLLSVMVANNYKVSIFKKDKEYAFKQFIMFADGGCNA